MKEPEYLNTDEIKKILKVDDKQGKKEDPKTEELKYADNQFFGCWYSYKTTHIININGTTKDSVPQMIERIQMVKPFEIFPVDNSLKK